jgi:two-component system chemotaxis response regulator CheY
MFEPERGARKRRVLVVDDAHLQRLYCRQALEPAGFEVDEAMNGLEALEKLLRAPADLVIVDINMPRMDGITFLETLRRQALPLASTPAIVTSTEAGEQDISAARAAGANLYRVKPIAPETLRLYAAMFCGAPEE